MSHYLKLMLVVFALFFYNSALANPIVIRGKQVIDRDTVYNNVRLDLMQGYFEVTNNAKLELNNCAVTGALALQKPNLIKLVNGSLILKNNQFDLTSTPSRPLARLHAHRRRSLRG